MGFTDELISKASNYLNNLAKGPSAKGDFTQNDDAKNSRFTFPDNLGTQRYPHLMKFSAIQYPDYQMYKKQTAKPVSNIFLPVPDNLAVSQQHDWSNFNLAEMLQNYEVVANVVGGPFESLLNRIGISNTDLFDASDATVEGLSKLAEAGLGLKDATRAALASVNRAVNPRYELMFNSTTPRQYVFDFKMVPKDAKESAAIKKIIDEFQKWALPSAANELARYLTPPAIWGVRFYFGENPNNYLFKLLNCALVGIDVSYPNGGNQFASFYDGYPIETALQLRFAETNALTRERYQSLVGI